MSQFEPMLPDPTGAFRGLMTAVALVAPVWLIGAIVTALPDLRNVELDIIAERDIVSVRATVDGTHKGDLLGIPASGKHVQWDAIDNYRVVDGKISEEWAADDLLAFVYGVGAYTPPWLAGKA